MCGPTVWRSVAAWRKQRRYKIAAIGAPKAGQLPHGGTPPQRNPPDIRRIICLNGLGGGVFQQRRVGPIVWFWLFNRDSLSVFVLPWRGSYISMGVVCDWALCKQIWLRYWVDKDETRWLSLLKVALIARLI
jgi:hypothetical protein